MRFARNLLNVAGYCVAGQTTAHFLDDRSAGFDWNFEVSGTGNPVELVQVVRNHAKLDQMQRQVALSLDGIVDTSQKHSLVQHSQRRFDEAAQRGRAVVDEFGRVVGVYDKDHFHAARRKLIQERLRDAVGEDNRQSRVNPNSPQMRDIGKTADEIAQPLIGQHERVASTEQNLFDRGILAQGIESGLPVGKAAWLLTVRIVPPETVATVDGAGTGRDQQSPTVVLVQEAGGEPEAAIVNRVRFKVGQLVVF